MKSIIEEYLSQKRIKIWQRIWEFDNLEFIADDFGKSIQKEIRWFVKKGFLIKKISKGEITYKSNKRKRIVRKAMELFMEICLNSIDVKCEKKYT